MREIPGEIADLFRYQCEIRSHDVRDRVTVLTLGPGDGEEWYQSFEQRVVEDVADRRNLRVCRLADGEYRFMFGIRSGASWTPVSRRARTAVVQAMSRVRHGRGFTAATRVSVSSGSYSRAELTAMRGDYRAHVLRILERGGIVAPLMSLSADARTPSLAEPHLADLAGLLRESPVELDAANVVNFYFVYKLLARAATSGLFAGQRILVVHSATGDRRERIRASLGRLGAADVVWHTISPSRSMFDQLPAALGSDCTLALIGAGVGKVMLMNQLVNFPGPCLDAGYMFEVWDSPELGAERMFCGVA